MNRGKSNDGTPDRAAEEQHINEFKEGSDAVTRLSNIVARHVLPLFIDDDRGRPVLVGSGFLVAEGATSYLVSAAHVFDALREGRNLYYYVQPNTKRKLSGNLRTTKLSHGRTRQEDRLDIGVLNLQGPGLPPYPEVDKYPLPIEALRANALPREMKQYLLVGFPGSKTRVNPSARRVLSKTYAFRNKSARPSTYSVLGVSPQSHIVITFDRKRVFGHEKQVLAFPDPSGMSGSPLWLLYDENGPNDRRQAPVVGVAIEHHREHHAIVATDIEIALRLIRGDVSSRR